MSRLFSTLRSYSRAANRCATLFEGNSIRFASMIECALPVVVVVVVVSVDELS